MARVPDRARPPDPPALEAYAQTRGLTWGQEGWTMPFGCLCGDRPRTTFNRMSGPLPGGAQGFMAHRVLRDRHTAGDANHEIFEAATVAAVLVPEAKATIQAATFTDLFIDPDLEHLLILARPGRTTGSLAGDTDWRVITLRASKHDISAAEALWQGQVGDWLRANLPRSALDIRAGMVSLWRQGHHTDPAALDYQAQLTEWLAGAVRAHCLPHTVPVAFGAALPEPPAWGSPSRKLPDRLGPAVARAQSRLNIRGTQDLLDPGAHDDRAFEAVRDFAHGYAQARGLALEDPRSFDLAFPSLPISGWTQAAWRGALPDGRQYRVTLTAQRPFTGDLERVYGAVAAMAEAPGSPDAPLRWDEGAGHFAATAGAVRVVWRSHRQMNVDHDLLDDVTARLRNSL